MPSPLQRRLANLVAVLVAVFSLLPRWLMPVSEPRFREWFPWYQTVHWFMSNRTRRILIEGTRELGEAFMHVEDLRASDDFASKEEAHEAYEAAKDRLVQQVVIAIIEDPFGKDLFHRPCVFTRLNEYMKLDGIQPAERKLIIKRIRQRT
ncbi:MAG: hypothetical protein WD099_11010, partial [Dongiaceae bacterium]